MQLETANETFVCRHITYPHCLFELLPHQLLFPTEVALLSPHPRDLNTAPPYCSVLFV